MNPKIILIVIVTLVLTACLGGEDTGSVVVKAHEGYILSYTLENATLVNIKISSTSPIEVYVTPTEDDTKRALEREQFTHYPRCSIGQSILRGESSCTLEEDFYIIFVNREENNAIVDFEIKFI